MGNISVSLFSENSAYANSNYIISKLQEVLMETETIWDFIPLPINSYSPAKAIGEQFVGFVYDLKTTTAYIVLIYENSGVPVVSLKVLINKPEQTVKTKKFAINQMEFLLDDAMKRSSEILSL